MNGDKYKLEDRTGGNKMDEEENGERGLTKSLKAHVQKKKECLVMKFFFLFKTLVSSANR